MKTDTTRMKLRAKGIRTSHRLRAADSRAKFAKTWKRFDRRVVRDPLESKLKRPADRAGVERAERELRSKDATGKAQEAGGRESALGRESAS